MKGDHIYLSYLIVAQFRMLTLSKLGGVSMVGTESWNSE
jgi:hypothetical protein